MVCRKNIISSVLVCKRLQHLKSEKNSLFSLSLSLRGWIANSFKMSFWNKLMFAVAYAIYCWCWEIFSLKYFPKFYDVIKQKFFWRTLSDQELPKISDQMWGCFFFIYYWFLFFNPFSVRLKIFHSTFSYINISGFSFRRK